jgi:vancomycin permeability regulator SanA
MVQTVSGLILTDEQAAALAADQPFDCILILGAGLQDDGSPSRILEDRVLTGCQIFLSDPAGFEAILMSGDQTGEYNEVAAMQTLAVAEGVDSDRIWLDPKGYSTYESVYRAKQVYGVRRVLIVTQEYHLYRALYIAQSLGLEAYGVSADRRTYRGELWRQGREVLARYKDYFIAGRGKYAEEVSA